MLRLHLPPISFSGQRRTEKGQGLVEYALILVLVAIVVIVVMALLGTTVRDTFADFQCVLKYGTATASASNTRAERRYLYQSRAQGMSNGGTLSQAPGSAAMPADGQGQCGVWYSSTSGGNTFSYYMTGPL
jgi:pilus assembly protein Flp/PilA